MVYNIFSNLFAKPANQTLVSVDIGTSAIKLMELDVSSTPYKLLSVGMAPTPAGSISNNVITKPEQIATTIRSIMDSNDMKSSCAIVGIPGPCAFTKKITMGLCSLKELRNNIIFEAANYIPHRIEAVQLDFQVVGTNGRTTMDVLLVAVKNEIIRGYLDAVDQAGLEPTIIDVDHFAIENMFELNYPEMKEKTVALVNVGSRYTGVNIVQDGKSLFTGDVSVGGKMFADALCEQLAMGVEEAEQAKIGNIPEKYDSESVREVLNRTSEQITQELHRQLGFFWNAAGTDKAIEEIYFSGGGAQLPGILASLSEKTGINCNLMETLKNVEFAESFDKDYLQEIAPSMGVSVGLALRRVGDKQHEIA